MGSLGCTNKDEPIETGDANTGGPEIAHTAAAEVLDGEALEIVATVSDPDGLSTVSLYHRSGGATSWSLLPMSPGDDGSFVASLDTDDVAYPAVEYYFKATDAAAAPATGYLPEGDPTGDPFVVPVIVTGAGLPYVEDFEPDDGVTPTSLADLGWGSASTEFRGYPWETSDAQAFGGTQSAFHSRGVEGTELSKDWLVSPAIDLSGTDSAQVTWQEYGNFADEGAHALYISTTNRDPSDGTYVLVTDLPSAPEDVWDRSVVVDLEAYVGNTVYLAWYFEGAGADDWYLDDVRVEGLQADLETTWAVADVVHPGESVELTVTVTNVATVDATDVVVSLGFPEGGASLAADSVTLPSIAAGGVETATFTVDVAEEALDNRYIPMTLDLAWGASTQSETAEFLVGYASTATVDWSCDAEGSLEIVVGVGDPDAPSWSQTLYADSAVGDLTITGDITDAGDYLPPAAGHLRWWASADTVMGGSFQSFEISYGGQSYLASVLPILSTDSFDVCWLPEPPAFNLSATTLPASLDPGSSGVRAALSITNVGADTAGPVTATLSSTDGDVTVTDAGPVTVSAGVMASGGSATLSAFRFDVATSHVDSTPVELDITLDDGVESWVLPVSFAVPYPVFAVTSVEIDDDGGDGLLDPGETGQLTVNLTNVGGENSVGTVSGVLSVNGGSVVSATTPADDEVFGTIGAGATQDARFDITVVGGAAGEVLSLDLALTDTLRSYSSSFDVVLGEPPWNTLSTSNDADNDALEGWDFDMVNGSYRVFDDVMQLRIESSILVDPSSAFVEVWGTASGADYIYYRIVAQSGRATLEGYDSTDGFLNLPDPTLSYPDAYTLQFDFPVADLDLSSDRLSLGFGSGWCGEPEYYCDSFPDAWGYPYDTFSTFDWFPLAW